MLQEKRTSDNHPPVQGIASIFAAGAAIATAFINLLSRNMVSGLVYGVALATASLLLLFLYCSKCPHAADGSCRHTIPGWLAKMLFTLRPPSPYTPFELIVSYAPFIATVLIPFWWLKTTPLLLLLYLLFSGTALVLVVSGVCPRCGNTYCPFCTKKR